MKLIKTIKVENMLGESPLWDPRLQALWWTDVEANLLFKLNWGDDNPEIFELPKRLTSMGLTVNTYELVCAFEDGFAYFRPRSGELKTIYPIDQNEGLSRMNDGRISPEGRMWSGSMAEGLKQPGIGELYSLTGDIVRSHRKGLTISNGIAWSPDGGTLYFTDTATRTVEAYDYDAEAGDISNMRLFCKPESGVPDGAVTDTLGGYWSALWGGSRVQRYTSDGGVDIAAPVPAKQPTCPAFGGPDMRHMFVTTARLDMPGRPPAGSGDGDLYIFETEFKGLAEPIFGKGRMS